MAQTGGEVGVVWAQPDHENGGPAVSRRGGWLAITRGGGGATRLLFVWDQGHMRGTTHLPGGGAPVCLAHLYA